ncbi:sensor histidine kinase [Spelaeicoccus albus]
MKNRRLRNLSVPTAILVAQMATIAIVVGMTAATMLIVVRSHNVDMARERAVAVSRTVSHAPSVVRALHGSAPSSALQPYSVRMARDNGMDFVTIFNTEGIRYTHTDRSAIGEKMIRGFEPALHGTTFTEEFDGSRGESVRSVSPITDSGGNVIALVTAGVTVRNLNAEFEGQLGWIVALAVIVFAIGVLISWFVSRIVRRITGDFGAHDLRRMFNYYQSVLRSVREGLLLTEPGLGIVLRNDEATRLLELPPEGGRPLPLDDVSLPESLRELLASRRPAIDEIHLTKTRVLVVNQSDGGGAGSPTPGWSGTVVTLRDRTELQSLAGELDSVKSFADSLRSQAHEFANRMHTMVSLIELGRSDEAIEFATDELAMPQALTDQLLRDVGEPVVSALLLSKTALANERGIDLDLRIRDLDRSRLPAARELVTILGNLLDNAFDAVAEHDAPRIVRLTLSAEPDGLLIRAADSGPGIAADSVDDVFKRGWTSKAVNRVDSSRGIGSRGIGLALVAQAVRRLGGRITANSAGDELRGAEFVVFVPDGGVPGDAARATESISADSGRTESHAWQGEDNG